MVKIIACGKIKEKALIELINEYLKRLKGYTKIEIIEVKEEKIPQNASIAQEAIIKETEGKYILEKIKDDDYVVLLDLKGKMIDSIKLSNIIDEVFTYKSSSIVFVIGGSLGTGDNINGRADYHLKLSDLTFPHQIVRLLILEQIYRSFKILNNETYHK